MLHKDIIDGDLSVVPMGKRNLLWQLTFHKDFRNLFYNRLGDVGYILNLLTPKQHDLYMNRGMKIGKRCSLVHAHTTHLNARSIGDDFQCFHLVTIGDSISPHGIPTIGNNVRVCCGACVLGNITIGNHVTIAAGAVGYYLNSQQLYCRRSAGKGTESSEGLKNHFSMKVLHYILGFSPYRSGGLTKYAYDLI